MVDINSNYMNYCITIGLKSTINRNNFDTTQCRTERYQIIDYTTVGNSDCVFQKSKCVQEGQITYAIKNESSLEDRKCMCDYTKGYSFINLPKDPCYCSPSVEDCSCYRELCSSGKPLSSGKPMDQEQMKTKDLAYQNNGKEIYFPI